MGAGCEASPGATCAARSARLASWQGGAPARTICTSRLLDRRHAETGNEVFLVLDNGPCHTGKASQAALPAREAWLPR